ncbi:sialic acid-binding Ig-like lectin 14 [Pelobates cultripes]|uniref:Sialic acid-binding Ig-like lectin 14 n=1 Tax=Pelobates cultripes TaxID=61616 RepID=A0AAD1RL78_PELCU|nr:sialic acid-binding Ig-like lectin 14 [Pelobates cultripes]
MDWINRGSGLRFILVLLLFQGIQCTSDHFCIHQLQTLIVTEGGSVTIPCSYTHPDSGSEDVEFRIHWGESNDITCNNVREVYKPNVAFIDDKYKGRISIERNCKENRTELITIDGLKKTDGPVICCQVIVSRKDSKPYTLNDAHGTHLLFSGKNEVWVDQIDVIPALPGETIIIPCYVHQNAANNISVQQVTWKRGNSCSSSDYEDINTFSMIERFSVANFPVDISLSLENLHVNDSSHYCCKVRFIDVELRSPGTELVIKDYNSLPWFNVIQLQNSITQIGASVIIKCTFTNSRERDLLYSRVYWKVGSLWGPYAYHPSDEMVDPRYRGRTELNGKTDLNILDIQKEDATSYYCFVVLTFCDDYLKYKSVTDHGQGTRLTVKGFSDIIAFQVQTNKPLDFSPTH